MEIVMVWVLVLGNVHGGIVTVNNIRSWGTANGCAGGRRRLSRPPSDPVPYRCSLVPAPRLVFLRRRRQRLRSSTLSPQLLQPP